MADSGSFRSQATGEPGSLLLLFLGAALVFAGLWRTRRPQN